MGISSIKEAIVDIRSGKMVILVDDEDRENEGDLCMAAQFITPEAINFMAKYGRGLICLTLTEEHADKLGLFPMVRDNRSRFGTAFTVSIEAKRGVSTGISAADRATTIQAAIADDVNLIDARSVAQFIGQEKTNTVQALGHIPTAVNINFDKFYDVENASFAKPEVIASLLDQSGGTSDEGLIAFCNTGHLASIAWFGLSEVQGIDKVRLYDGSMSQWTADPSRPVVTN